MSSSSGSDDGIVRAVSIRRKGRNNSGTFSLHSGGGGGHRSSSTGGALLTAGGGGGGGGALSRKPSMANNLLRRGSMYHHHLTIRTSSMSVAPNTTKDTNSSYGGTAGDENAADGGGGSEHRSRFTTTVENEGDIEGGGDTMPLHIETGGGDKKGSAAASPSSPRSISSVYEQHPYLLYFTNRDTEQRYYDFQYVDTYFVPGKMFALVWVFLIAFSFIIFTGPFDDKGEYMIESFTSKWWSYIYISAVINIVLSVGLFVHVLKPFREAIHLAQVFFGWPALYLVTLVLKKPYVFNYGFLFGCTGFSMLIVQVRVCRVLPFITLWPLICLFGITFSIPAYWEEHTKLELMYWVILLIPTLLVYDLEKRVRQSFVEKNVAMIVIADSIHKKSVTQKMIANFFPATPTRDLLQQLNGPRDRAYPDTVLIVTDIAGFTAYTSRSDPTDVIEMLTVMFQAFDKTSQGYNVEKIATVGDSYCGAVFPTHRKAKSSRCSDAVSFACSALPFAGFGLQLRVGVHIGDIVGVFVGCVPPKFDLFGPGIDHARIMEEDGRPGFVHISTAVLDTLPSRPSSIVDTTSKGVLCTMWGEEFTNGFNMSDDAMSASSDYEVLGPQGRVLDSDNIVRALCAFANLNPVEGGDDGDHTTATPQTMSMAVSDAHSNAHSHVSSTEHEMHEVEVDTEESEDADEFAFHRLFLVFKTNTLERRYKRHVQDSGINEFCSRMFLIIAFCLLVIQLNLQCGGTQDLGVASSILGIIMLLSVYLLFIGTKNKYHFMITCTSYSVMLLLCIFALTADCDGLANRSRYVGNTFSTYSSVAVFASQYCLDTRLIFRIGSCVAIVILFTIGMVIRNFTYGDNVAPLDPLPLCGMAFVIVSFFPDYSLRTAFRTELQLRKLRKTARSKGAAMATSALSIMLPTFVTERIIELSKEAARAKAPTQAQLTASETHTNTQTNTHSVVYSAAHTNGVADEVADLDINAVAATWEYPHAVLMFVKFHSDDPSFTPAAINSIVQAIERIMVQFEVMKVKTIGSTVMLVSGIDDPRTRQEQLTGVVDAAIMIRACVFPNANVAGLTYHIGIHSGPCFGAVIGGNGAIFDLFGDTVNTASRTCSTAAVDSIQVSSVANGLILPRLREFVDPLPAVHMKGKGTMEVFGIRADAGVDCLPDYKVRHFTKSALRIVDNHSTA